MTRPDTPETSETAETPPARSRGDRRSGDTASEGTFDADLGDLVMRVARALRRRGADAMAPWDIAPHHARALKVIGRHERIRPGELAGHLRVAPRSVTDVVDALEARGLLAREPDPSDRRATVLVLTASGRQLVEEIGSARRADADTYFARLSESDRASLQRILRTLDDG